MKNSYLVSANTLLNVEEVLKDGVPKTSLEIAASIKRNYTTVYRALCCLAENGKVSAVRQGKKKYFFIPREPRKPTHRSHEIVKQFPDYTQVFNIQREAKAYLAANGPTLLIDLVKALDYPRSSCYSAVAELRRINHIRINEMAQLELNTPTAIPTTTEYVPAPEKIPPPIPSPVTVVPTPDMVPGTPNTEIPVIQEEPRAILAHLVRAITEKVLEEALKPEVRSLLPQLASHK